MIDKKYTLKQSSIIGFVVAVIAFGFVMYTSGAYLSSTTDTIALTTSTLVSVTTYDAPAVTTTFSSTSYIIQTTTKLVQITYTGPDNVLITGHASTPGLGKFATDIIFVNSANNATKFDATINQKDGTYSQQLPNHQYYYVQIKFGTSLSNVGAGTCSAGALAAYFGDVVPAYDWQC